MDPIGFGLEAYDREGKLRSSGRSACAGTPATDTPGW
jgi:hypothetical protein